MRGDILEVEVLARVVLEGPDGEPVEVEIGKAWLSESRILEGIKAGTLASANTLPIAPSEPLRLMRDVLLRGFELSLHHLTEGVSRARIAGLETATQTAGAVVAADPEA